MVERPDLLTCCFNTGDIQSWKKSSFLSSPLAEVGLTAPLVSEECGPTTVTESAGYSDVENKER